jgi:hypothetical protein
MNRWCFFFLFSIVFFSCQKSEPEFSCDPAINTFVSENREELSRIDIYELTSFEPELQRAVFNSWDYRKKRDAWIDKLCYLLENEEFSETETEHIHKLIDHIGPDYFLKENFQHEADVRSLFAAYWTEYAHNTLGWSRQFIAFVVYRLYTNQPQLEDELSALRMLNASVMVNSEYGCDCNMSSDFCSISNCLSTACTTSSLGCGWLWSMPCNGNCY